jgi:hypothetical protein
MHCPRSEVVRVVIATMSITSVALADNADFREVSLESNAAADNDPLAYAARPLAMPRGMLRAHLRAQHSNPGPLLSDCVFASDERLDPEVYLRGYYVRWLRALERQLETRRFLGEGELDARLRKEEPSARGTRKLPAWQRALRTWLTRKSMAPMSPWLARLYPKVQGFARSGAAQQSDWWISSGSV